MLVNFSPIKAEKFSAVFDLIEFGLSHTWELSSDKSKVDLYIIEKDSDVNFIPKQNKAHCFAYIESGQSKVNNAILHDTDYVPFSHDLIEQLNKVASIASCGKTPLSYSPPQFLKQLLEASDPLSIDLGSEVLYVNPEQHSFYYSTSLEKLNDYITLGEDLAVEVITAQALSELTKSANLSPQPLTHLIWHTTFITSNGRLIDSLSEQDIFRLNDWPYLGVSSREYIKLATYLKTHRASLADAIKESDTPTDIANDFYNASHLAGLIEDQPQTDALPTSLPKESLSFLDKIKNRLRH